MLLIDQWVEKHIKDARDKGEFDNLVGHGKTLVLDDDKAVPKELRVAYRILKNAGYLPPALQDRKEALELVNLLQTLSTDNQTFVVTEKRLKVLRFRLQQAGMNIDFIEGHYRHAIRDKFQGE